MDPNQRGWFTSSFCDLGLSCVEVRFADALVLVRHRGEPTVPALMFDHAEWEAFLRGVENGEFTIPVQ